jgi:hypothetical protein
LFAACAFGERRGFSEVERLAGLKPSAYIRSHTGPHKKAT